MRLWSLHPKYLDSKGLVALWREALLAKHVLEGKTRGYKNHPQLNRFKKSKKTIDAINQYLTGIYSEAKKRGYHFDRGKINHAFKSTTITVTNGQIGYELKHLLNKLKSRDPEKHKQLLKIKVVENHPLFKVIEGDIAEWEIGAPFNKKNKK